MLVYEEIINRANRRYRYRDWAKHVGLSIRESMFVLAVIIYPNAAADAQVLRDHGIGVSDLELAETRADSLSYAQMQRALFQAKQKYPGEFEC